MYLITLKEKLQEIARNRHFKSAEIKIIEAPKHGYSSIGKRIIIQDSVGARKLQLYSKEKPDDATKAWEFLYKHEEIFYGNILPEFIKITPETLQRKLPLPKCYFACEDFIIFEDLSYKGYKLWNPRSQPLDTDHVKIVLEAYARFHALSFAFKHQKPEKFKSMGPKYEIGLSFFEELKAIGYYKQLSKILADCFDPETESQYIHAVFKLYERNHSSFLNNMIESDKNDVFAHGDCWTHNYMFRYDKNGQPVEITILDFQLYRRSNPINDLSYFLTASACTEEVFGSIWEYLKVYHQCLEKCLVKLNCPTNVYTWDIFKEEWGKFSVNGLMISAIALKMMVADEDELESRNEIDIPMRYTFVSRNEELYKKGMRVVVKYFYDSDMMAILDEEK